MIPTPGAPPESATSAAPSRGITAEAMRLFSSISRHLQALAGLAGEEGRHAAGVYLRLAIAVGVALVMLGFGYVFALLFIAFALATVAGVAWIWIALAFAIIHFLVVAGCAFYVKARYRTPVFRATAEEIRRDIAAMRGPTP